MKSIVDYKFSNTEVNSSMWKNSYTKKLSPPDQAAYQSAYNAYVGDNTVDNNTDLPF